MGWTIRGAYEYSGQVMNYPIKAYSWEVLSPSVAVKHMDKSAFLHHGTGVPKEIAYFFGLDADNLKESRPAVLICAGYRFSIHFQMDARLSRFRMFWKADFSKLIKSKFPDFHKAFKGDDKISDDTPLMRFERFESDVYEVELILSDVIQGDVLIESLEDSSPRPEGAVKQYYGKRYERDPRNRRLAIAYHGLHCQACGFNFAEAYGKRGDGFIEVHHAKPLGTTGEQHVDPKTDLAPLCANCHRMIHRRSDDVLTVAELRTMIKDHAK